MREGRLQLVGRAAVLDKPSALRGRLLLATALACAWSVPASAEPEPTLDATQLVDASLLAGEGWHVERAAPVRGYQARFQIRTDWGDLTADSVDLLQLRVAEMPALRALHRAKVTDVLVASSLDDFSEPVEALAAIADEPGRAALELPLGVSRYFGERWQRLRGQARRLADRSHDLMLDGSPYDDPQGPLGAAASDAPQASRGWWQRRGRDVSRLARSEAGVPAARQALAERLSVDPYTRNPLVGPRLDALAWVEATGRMASAELLGLVGGPAGLAMVRAMQVERLVLQAPPETVRQRNHEILSQYCLDERLVRGFLSHRAYSPGLQTQFTDLYVRLAPDDGCEALLETALMAQDEPQARFIVNGLRLIAHTLGDEVKGGRFVPQGALLAYQTAGGEFVLPLAVDWLAWTPEIRRWFDLPTIGNRPRRTVVIAGGLSALAERELTQRGWSLVSRPPYPGAPAYRRDLHFRDTRPHHGTL